MNGTFARARRPAVALKRNLMVLKMMNKKAVTRSRTMTKSGKAMTRKMRMLM
jgi:hypothetical protein